MIMRAPVGRVEQSETRRTFHPIGMAGCASLNPPYGA